MCLASICVFLLSTCSPDIQVGTPLIDIVEKVLESKAKELIPKISDAVDFLCETKASQLKEAASKNKKEPVHPPTSTLTQSNATTSVTEPAKSDFVDLSLPIDIPGLRPPIAMSAGTSSSVKKDNSSGNDTKQNKARQKGTADGTISKDTTKTGNKSKGLVNLKSVTPFVVKDSGKSKGEQTQNKDKERSVTEKEAVSLEKSGKEKEKSKMSGRIPKKQKLDKKDKDTVEKQDLGTVKNVDKEQPETHKADTESSTKEKIKPSEEPVTYTPAKRRSARLASQTESKADSESDDQESDKEVDLAASNSTSRKRPKSSINPASKKARVMISSSSDEFEYDDIEVSSGGYESDTDQQSEEDLSMEDRPRKAKRKRKLHDDTTTELLQVKKSKLAPVASPTQNISKPNKRKSNPPRRISSRTSKSPPVVVTRYNRSVKPNRRYCEGSAEVNPNEEELETEREGTDQTQSSDTVKTNTDLDTTRPCDVNADLEIDSSALVTEKDEMVYTMTNPKPVPLKIRKTQARALRSRQKTKTRISFFCHR